MDAIDTAMEPITVLREEFFEVVDQSDYGCFYFPDLEPGEPVVLPGQCDSDSVIPVMTNFNASAVSFEIILYIIIDNNGRPKKVCIK